MSNLRSLTGQANPRVPTPPRGESIARYETYLEAQRAVDYLSDQQFPVQAVTIVGTGLRMVERVTGRLTYPRVAGASALSGLYFGFFVGLALSLFGGGNDLSIFAVALVGAGFGMLFGIISYALTGGRRDFTSTSQIVASEYEVLCLADQANAARDLLRKLPGGTGRGRRSSEHGAGAGWASGGPGTGPGYSGGGTGSYGGVSGPNPYAAGGQVQRPGEQLPPPGAPSPYGPPPVGSSPYGPAPDGAEVQSGHPEVQPGHSGTPQPGGEPAPARLVGPTYGEMIERQRQEQRAREAAEREAAEREAAEREAAEREAAEREAAEREAVKRQTGKAPPAQPEKAGGDRTVHEPGGGPGRRNDLET